MTQSQASPAAMAGPDSPADEARYGRDFRLYATGQAVSVVGDRIASIALVFLIIHIGRSYAPALALFYLCRLIPSLAGGLLAGVFVDHYNRQRLMVGCDLARAVLLIAVPALSSLTLWVLYPMVFALFTLTLLFDTAARAGLPDVVSEDRMLGANAILQSIETAADFAYAAGGALVYFFALRIPFYIDAATFIFSALMVAGMQLPSRTPGPLPRVGEVLTRIREGTDHLIAQPFLKWSSVTFAFAPLAGGIAFVLAPLYASRVLGQSPGLFGPLRSGAFRFSVLEVAIGLGALAGSALAGRLAKNMPRGRLFGIGMSGMGLSYVLLGFTSNLYLAVSFVALSGVFNSMFVIAGMTLLQTLTPSDIRGRVLAARLTIINGSLALGAVVAGALLLIASYQAVWILAGLLILSSSLFIWLRNDVRGQA